MKLQRRQREVYFFYKKLLRECNNWDKRHPIRNVKLGEQSAHIWCFGIFPPAWKVFWSFKTLRLENWLTQEEIKKLYS